MTESPRLADKKNLHPDGEKVAGMEARP